MEATSRVCLVLLVLASGSALANEIEGLQKLAAGDVRMIADGVRSYAAEQNKYPGALGQFADAGTLEPDLVPGHLEVLPAVDPWGRPYWYWTNGEHFLVGSGGPDEADRGWRANLATDPRGPATVLQSLCASPGQRAVLLVDGRFCALSKSITEAKVS